jgi:hypothetical protein
MQGLCDRGMVDTLDQPRLTQDGRAFFEGLGVDIAALEHGRRPLCRSCLDWSERRAHLGGALGAAVLEHVLAEGWARRREGRVVEFSRKGEAAYDAAFGLSDHSAA